jgi:DNA-binding SARP family transcriptional activator
MDFRILGPFEIEGATGPLHIRGAKRRGVLALLVSHAREVLTRDRIVEELWGEPTPAADHTVQSYVSQLRKALDPDVQIETVGRAYRFVGPRGCVDAERFSDLADAAVEEPALEKRRQLLADALADWRGGALEEFAGAPWAEGVATRLERRRLEVLERRIDADLALGRSRELLSELDELVCTYPFAEPLWAQRMLALYRCGRQADALRAYTELRSTLASELGIEPSRALAELERRILDQDEALSTPARSDDHALIRPTTQLPVGTVTFLLTDIVSSSEMWELEPDAMAASVREHEAIIGAVVEALSGHLLKHRGEGDSTLSVFDRAAAAVEAAVKIQEVMARAHERLELPLALRIGLHTGEVEQRDSDYFGRTLNRAARIRGLAVENEILCSRVTADLVTDALPPSVALVELGTRELRGLRRNEVVFRVTGTNADDTDGTAPESPKIDARRSYQLERLPSRLLASLTSSTSLVGRARETTVLTDAWQRARAGDHQIVFISGEPGIGKTRLAAEAAIVALNDGATVLYGRSDEGLGVPFQPFAEALRSFVQPLTDEQVAPSLGGFPGELVRILPDISERAIELSAPLRSDPATEQYRLFDAVASWLGELSNRKPVFLVLDDLQEAADPTLLLLRHIASSERLRHALIVATYRESEPGHTRNLIGLLADLRTACRTDAISHLALGGLDEDGVGEFVANAHRRALDESTRPFVRMLQAHTGGNPFFVNEMLRSFAETGRIGRDAPALREADLREMEMPAAAREVVLRRVARLSEQGQRALTVGAVIGSEFSVAIVEAVTGGDDEEILDALEEATFARLVVESRPDHFAFAHALVQAALYESLTESRQLRMHRRVAEAIERRASGSIGEHLSELAYHYARTEPAKAVRYAVAAADAALESLAFEDAVNICERALTALEGVRGSDRAVERVDECDLLLLLGRAEFRAGRARARDTVLRCFALARELGDAQRMAAAVLTANRGFFARMGGTDRQLVQALEETLEAQPPGRTALLAELLAALASELEWTDDGDRRFALSDRALGIAREAGDVRTLTRVLSLRPLTIAAPDTLAERKSNCDELLKLADEVGDPAIIFQAAWSRSSTAVESGEFDEVDKMVDLVSRLSEELRQPTFRWQASFMRAARSILRGHLEEAERLALETLELGQRANQAVEAFLFYNEQMLEIRRWQDRLAEIIGPLRDFAGNPASDFGFALTRYLYDAGDREYARSRYDAIMATFRAPPRRDLLAATSVCNLAYLAARFGDARRAATLYETIRPYAHTFANTTVAKPVGEHFLGMLAAAQNDVDTAEAHFGRALAANEHAGAPLLAAETQLEWAGVLAQHGNPHRLSELLDAARATATANGAGFVERRCREIAPGADRE